MAYTRSLPPSAPIWISFSAILLIQLVTGFLNKGHTIFNLLVGQILFLSTPLFFILRGQLPLLSHFPRTLFRRPASLILLALCVMIGIEYLLAATHHFLPVPESVKLFQQRLITDHIGLSWPYQLILLAIIPACCEELYFRGFCQHWLVRFRSPTRGIVVASLLFAIAHVNIWYFHLYFILGLFLGWLFHITRTLWVPIVVHALNNTLTIVTIQTDAPLPLNGHKILNLLIIATVAIVAFISWKRFIFLSRCDHALQGN